MSYFVCQYEANSADVETLNRLLLDIVPVKRQTGSLKLGSRSSHLVSYGREKVIPDVAIVEGDEGSWLTVLGTPLISLEDEQSEQAFLDAFLSSPRDLMRRKIDGNFALFSYDSKGDRFLAATDFNNTTPIFYTITPNGVHFSSHELVLAKFMGAQIDPLGFAQAMHLGVPWGSRTRFKNIFKMLPCQILVIDSNKRILAEHYWKPQEESVFSGSFEEIVAMWMSFLKDSIWNFYECAHYKPVMSSFTGGEDARLIVAQCHALGIPFKTQVTGLPDDSDVIVAKRAASRTGFDLMVRPRQWLSEEDLVANIGKIILSSDGYQELLSSCVEFATDMANPLSEWEMVTFSGNFGGEAFRGGGYLRGKAIFPSRGTSLDYKFHARLKFLLDYHPGLLHYSDDDLLESIHEMYRENLKDVEGFPLGTQIDHVLRVFQTCFVGMKYKTPLYYPFGTKDLTRSVYFIPPHHKRGGKLTRTCTEILFPELAVVRTQNGVPTLRKTLFRLPLFIPEYIHLMEFIASGVLGRLFKWTDSNKWYYSVDRNATIFTTLLNTAPYCDWFSSPRSMVTGRLYNADVLNSILAQAKAGSCRYVPILGRVIKLELACRWVYREGL